MINQLCQWNTQVTALLAYISAFKIKSMNNIIDGSCLHFYKAPAGLSRIHHILE